MLEIAKIADLEQIVIIVKDAQARMKQDNLIQWQDGYPTREILATDIDKGQMYKLEIAGQVAGICVINDDYYSQYPNTLDKEQCLMIHRVAVSSKFLNYGVGTQLLNGSCELIKQFGFDYAVIDTNSQNLKMIKLIEKANFTYVSDFELVENAPLWKVFVKRLSV
ncbi:GNAT family N-acetyltransferase [Mollicutes bacterium LVI A0039]|nr:GNAT family N-acetyltransferase [Mollicutes bacterium LVI A0039]